MKSMDIIKGTPSTMGDNYHLNINDLLRYAARTFPEREVVSRELDGTVVRLNYKQSYERVKRLANALEKLNVQPGDRVGALDWNTHRYFEMYNAIPGIGAVLLQLNPRISMQERSYVVNHSEAKFIVVNETFLPILEPIAEELKTVKGYVVITNKDVSEIKTKLAPLYSYEKLLADASPEYTWPMVDEKSAYSSCYTSGTTGKPKGVFYSHRAIYLHTYAFALQMNVSLNDCVMQTVPMFHAQGWGLFFTAPLTGAKLVFPGMYTADDTSVLVNLLISEKVTVTSGAPAIFMPMLEHIKKLDKKPDLTGLRMASGATEPPLSMMRSYWDMGKAEIIHAYGATETTPIVTINLLKPSLDHLSMEDKWNIKKRQGLIVSGVDVKIVKPDGTEVEHDGQSVGEVRIRGPWITCSYHNDSRTEEAFVDGYWKSADAATIDENGYVKITDRYKDLIKSGGEWISSIDLENIIMAHPAVLEAAVVGLPHPKWQERPLAIAIIRPEFKDKVTKEDILEFIAPKFAKWQLPDQILFVDQIPKTSVGKFAKRIIREQYENFYEGAS
jgi:fatty-acyl-CoA synthase